MSNLVDHARRELTILGEEPEYIEQVCKIVQAFADMGHSGFSAAHCTGQLHLLLQYKNLKPLTNNPIEWMLVQEDIGPAHEIRMWQNTRNSEAFSNDGGKTYWLLSDGSNAQEQHIIHTAEKVTNGSD